MTNNSDPFGSPSSPTSSGNFDFNIDVKKDPLPAVGLYTLRVADVQASNSQAGNPMLVWDFIVVGKDIPTIRSWTSLQSNAKWKVVEYLQALGLNTDGDTVAFNRRDVIGKIVVGDMEHRADNKNVMRFSIKKLISPDEVGDEQLVGHGSDRSDIPE